MGDTLIVNTARYWLGRSLLVTGHYTDAKALLETVVDAARESGDTFSLPMALSILGTEIALHGDEGLGFAYLDEAATIARRGGLPRTGHLAPALQMKAHVLLAWQDTAARPILDEYTGLAVWDGGVIFALTGLALVDVLDGDLDAAEARLQRRASDPSTFRATLAASFVNMVAAAIARARGDLDDAASFLQEALAQAPNGADGPAMSLTITILEMLARVLLAVRPDRRRSATARSHPRRTGTPPPPRDRRLTTSDTDEAPRRGTTASRCCGDRPGMGRGPRHDAHRRHRVRPEPAGITGRKGHHRCLCASAHVVLRMLTVRRKLYRTHAAMSDQAGGGPASST